MSPDTALALYRQGFLDRRSAAVVLLQYHGFGVEEIASVLKLPPGPSRSRARQREIPPLATTSIGPWTEKDEELLIELWNGKTALSDICERLDRSGNAINQRVSHLRKQGHQLMNRRIVPGYDAIEYGGEP